MVDLRSEQVIQHIHGRREEHALIRLTGAPAHDFGEEGLPHTGIADKDCAGTVVQELQIEQPQNAPLQFGAALMVFEVKAVDGMPGMEARETEAAFDRPAVTGFQFEIHEGFESLGKAEISGGGVSDRLIQLVTHRGQAELVQFLLQ